MKDDPEFKARRAAQNKRYYAQHAEQIRQRKKDYYNEHSEVLRAKHRQAYKDKKG